MNPFSYQVHLRQPTKGIQFRRGGTNGNTWLVIARVLAFKLFPRLGKEVRLFLIHEQAVPPNLQHYLNCQ